MIRPNKIVKKQWNTLTRFDSILLGDNAFYGIDHLSYERARERTKLVQPLDHAVDLIKYSYDLGINGMVVATRPKLKEWIELLRSSSDIVNKLDFYPVMPYARGLQMKLSKFGVVNALTEILKEGGLRNEIKILAKGGLGFMRNDIVGLFKAFLDIEMIKLNMIRTKIIFLHPVLVDIALALNMKKIFETFNDHLKDNYKIEAGLCTKNFPKLVECLEKWDLEFASIMTSFNTAGFLMNPSKQACEETLKKYNGNVLAMNIFAGGYSRLPEVTDYIFSQPKIRNIVFGTSSFKHAKETIEVFKNAK